MIKQFISSAQSKFEQGLSSLSAKRESFKKDMGMVREDIHAVREDLHSSRQAVHESIHAARESFHENLHAVREDLHIMRQNFKVPPKRPEKNKEPVESERIDIKALREKK